MVGGSHFRAVVGSSLPLETPRGLCALVEPFAVSAEPSTSPSKHFAEQCHLLRQKKAKSRSSVPRVLPVYSTPLESCCTRSERRVAALKAAAPRQTAGIAEERLWSVNRQPNEPCSSAKRLQEVGAESRAAEPEVAGDQAERFAAFHPPPRLDAASTYTLD